MALVGLLLELQRLHHWPLQLWHGDHGWHPGSAAIAMELQAWCIQRGLELQIDRAPRDLARTEEAARRWRYDALGQAAHRCNADGVTGHTASDRSETLLLQLARGTDLAGLAALRPVRSLSPSGPLLRRPLLGFSRSNTAAICRQLALPVWEDPSNQSLVFARNRIRAEVLPVLEDLHPGCSQRMAEQAERLSQVRDTQDELSNLVLEQLQTSGGLNRRRLGQLSAPTRRQSLALWCRQQGVPGLDARQLDQLSHRLRSGAAAGSCDLSAGWQLHWRGEVVSLKPPAAAH